MRIIFIIIMIIHGLIHFLGFLKAFNLSPVSQLTQNISRPAGLFWLLAGLLFLITAVLFIAGKNTWWLTGLAAIIISQILILIFWHDARYGTIINVILLLPIIATIAENLPAGYRNIYKSEVIQRLNQSMSTEKLSIKDIQHLPEAVQKYIVYSGSIDKEKINNFRVVCCGQIKPKPDSDFLDYHSFQYIFFNMPSRIYYIQSKMYGLPFNGLHLYTESGATMQIKIASFFQVVNARGPEMNKSETVTLFNDICIFAPAALIDKNIQWEIIDSLTVKAKFSIQGNTIGAILFFNEKGELINFSSNDRY